MFFQVATSFVAALFLGLAVVGLRHRSWMFVAMNLAGMALNALVLLLDVWDHLNTTILLAAMPALAFVLGVDVAIIFREPRHAVTPIAPSNGKVNVAGREAHPVSLLVTKEKRFLRELDRHTKLSAQNHRQALQFWRQGNDAHRQRNYRSAKTQYESSLKLATTPSALNNLAVVLLAINLAEAALQHCKRACGLDAEHHEAWHNRGSALLILERLHEALDCFHQAIAVQPNMIEPWIGRGNALVQLKRFEQSLECYDTVLGLNPRRPDCWNNRGVALSKMGKLQEAMASFERAVKIAPEYFPATLNRVLVNDKLRRFDQAKTGYRHFLQQPPPQMNGRLVLVRSRLRQLENNSVGQPVEIDLTALEPELAA